MTPLTRVSSFYRSDPVGFSDQPDFWNLAVEIDWPATPGELLSALQEIEHSVGRKAAFRDGPREIDIDILDFGGVRRDRPDPVLPHPRLSLRRFVLAPLAEIAPGWRHPVSGKSVKELLRSLPAKPGVRKLRSKS